jgi:8-oxo-dGTP diphosphatase
VGAPRAGGEESTPLKLVRAAGGIVVRDGEGGPEVLVVHRPRYDDWSFPKGKAERGETDEDCALREVEEETGLACVLGPELPSTRYEDARGRPKRVRYWRMTVTCGRLAFDHEVDAGRWLPVREAAELLSYARDREVLAALDR